jgi:REP element-mobilizing transposase RayT
MLDARQQMWGVETTKRRKRHAASTAGSTTASTANAASTAATRPRRPKRVPRQLSLAEAMRTRGGPRKGAGRKRKDPTARPNVVHRVRPAHRSELPVHITLRRAKGLPGFRSERLRVLLEQAIRDTRREGFRITHYSVQADHVHIIVEADDPTTLTNGMRSFAVRIAMRVNRRILGRTRGRVWGDRYHRRDLAGPRAVRNALVYVLANHLKHGEVDVGLLDPCSSGPWFTGWTQSLEPPRETNPVERARTWVLREGWITRGGGRIRLGEVPRALRE